MRWRTFGSYLKERFGAPVRKIPVDAGFTCPNRDGTVGTGGCAFCNNEAFSPPVRTRRDGRVVVPVSEQVKAALSRCRRKGTKFMVYFQSYSNTYAPVEVLRKRYEEAFIDPSVVALAVGTRPDCATEEVLDLLSSFADRYEVWLELGLQTIHNDILERINRGHTAGDFFRACERARTRPLKLCVHVVVGLPGDSAERNKQTAEALAHVPYHGLKLHPLQILAGTQFEKEYRSGRLEPLQEETYVSRAADFLERTPRHVVIQRLTADALPPTLVAPAWCAKPGGVIRDSIAAELKRRGTCQGWSV